jgi:hypothetical protein
VYGVHKAILTAAGLILLHSNPLRSEPAWTRAISSHLDLLTTADASLASRAVVDLEGLRSYFRQSSPAGEISQVSIRIVAFSSEWEFHDYRVNSYSPAYFAGGPGQAYIVLGRLSKDSLPALRHEMVHALLQQSGGALPLWLEEGLADYYGGIDAAQAGLRAKRLKREFLPLETLLTVTSDSADYRQVGFARRFYGQSWALVHLLLTHPRYQPGAQLFISLCRQGLPAREAFQQAYDASLPQVEADLRGYARRLRAKPAPRGPAESVQTGPADSLDVQLTLARIQERIGRQSALAAPPPPGRPESAVILGDAARRAGDSLAALLHYRQAVQLGSRDALMLWHLAVLEQSGPDPSSVVPVLELLIQADPTRDDARIVLSSHYLNQHRGADALRLLLDVRKVPPAQSAFYQQALALARSHSAETATLGTN